jgi:hypothetical protein
LIGIAAMIDDPVGRLFRHKERFYVILVEDRCLGWLKGRDARGQEWIAKETEFIPLTPFEISQFAPLFKTAKVIQGPQRIRTNQRS